MKAAILYICGTLAVVFLAVALWESPLAIGFKLKYGYDWGNDLFLLQASDGLSRRDYLYARLQGVQVRLGVANRQIYKAREMIDDLISKRPDDPNLRVMRAKIYASVGDFSTAGTDLQKARELIVKRVRQQDAYPTLELIDDMIRDNLAHKRP